MLARPIQLGARLAGVSDEKVNQVTKSIAGDFVAPTPQGGMDVLKDAGRALETAAPYLSKLALAKTGLIGGKTAMNSKILKTAISEVLPKSESFLKMRPVEQYNLLIELAKTADPATKMVAEKAIQEAQRQMEQNFLGAVQVPMGAYNNAVLQNVAQQQQSQQQHLVAQAQVLHLFLILP